ncbi:MAG: hypothetical protein ACLR9I_05705 [Eisenbergiella sp.]
MREKVQRSMLFGDKGEAAKEPVISFVDRRMQGWRKRYELQL